MIISKRLRGLDIRKFGSGNIGATNVNRLLGFKWGAFVFILDFLKGFIPVLSAFIFLHKDSSTSLIYIAVGLLAIAGHNWPIFLKFKGGKGVSTSIGVITSLAFNLSFLRVPVLLSILVWVIIFYVSHLVGPASLATGFVFFISCLLFKEVPWEFKVLSLLIAFFITIRHKNNIREIIKEYKGH